MLAFHAHSKMADFSRLIVTPQLGPQWTQLDRRSSQWQVDFANASSHTISSFRHEDLYGIADLHIAHFSGLSFKGDSQDYRNTISTEDWALGDSELEDFAGVPVTGASLSTKFGNSVYVRYWYLNGDTPIQGKLKFKLHTLKRYLQAEHGHSFIAVASFWIDASCKLAKESTGSAVEDLLH